MAETTYRKRSAASHRAAGKDATAQTNRTRQAGSELEGIRPPGCDSTPSTKAERSGTGNNMDLEVGLLAILTLRLELQDVHLWYLLERKRRLSPLSAQHRHRHKEIERRFGRVYLRGQVLPSKKSRLHADFGTNIQHFESKMKVLDRLISALKKFAGVEPITVCLKNAECFSCDL